jgi:hypothetical protein
LNKQGTLFSARGEPLPKTLEAWRYHAYLMADLAEKQAEEIRTLKIRNNKLEQSVQKLRRLISAK